MQKLLFYEGIEEIFQSTLDDQLVSKDTGKETDIESRQN